MNREPHYTIHLLLDSRTLGGIETHVLQLAKGLQKMGHHPRVVFLTDYGPHPLQRLLQQADIQYCTLGG
ncbi:MAG: glycosyltransferase, partial [Gammaproteobacteria bacterium]|nr:glycosyltransferase [Gammaproteobacteria bacterium]